MTEEQKARLAFDCLAQALRAHETMVAEEQIIQTAAIFFEFCMNPDKCVTHYAE